MAVALFAVASPATSAGAAGARFSGEVTDALRAPAHRLAAGPDGRAVGDLVFVDAQQAHTRVRACVRRRDVAGVHSCFSFTTGTAGVATVTPLRFARGRYLVRWSVRGAVVARWRFSVA